MSSEEASAFALHDPQPDRGVQAWIDIDNPPQVQYLLPFKRAFENAGCSVVVTARDYGITQELLRNQDIPFQAVGHQAGRYRVQKVAAVLRRAIALRSVFDRHDRPDLVVTASRAAAITARWFGIPAFTFCDYEFVDLTITRVTGSYVVFPDAIDSRVFLGLGLKPAKLIPFRGLKENISFSDVSFDSVEPYSFATAGQLPLVLFRPPAEQAHYYAKESSVFAFELLEHLSGRSDVQLVLSPRTDEQIEYVERFAWINPPIVLDHAVPFVSLLLAVDAVISAGGTMLREAAYLGIPAFSILRSEIGSIDKYLAAIGRLRIISRIGDFENVVFNRLERKPPLTRDGDDPVERLVREMLSRVPVDRSPPHSLVPSDEPHVHRPAQLERERTLERLLQLVEPPGGLSGEINGEAGKGTIRELRNGDWRVFAAPSSNRDPVGEEIARFTLDDGSFVSARLDHRRGVVSIPFDLDAAYSTYVSESWQSSSSRRALSPQLLDAFYRAKWLVPRRFQMTGRRLLIRWQGVPEFPRWPLDTSVSRLLRFYAHARLLAAGITEAEFRWFWPGGHTAALILTHDVESSEGLRRVLDIADIEEELGFRSSFNLGGWYRHDPQILRELEDRGFEIGVHGLQHDRSLFASRKAFDARQPALRDLAHEVRADGFRSPATHRVFDWLPELPFSYDCSIPNSDPFEPQPGGCCSPWPFFIGSLVELPYTLPQDHTLFTLLRHQTSDLWIEQADAIEREHGLIQCITHPDPGYLAETGNRERYVEFLRAMSGRSHVWKALPREVAEWWRKRDEAGSNQDVTLGRIRLGSTPSDLTFEPPEAD